MIELKSDLGGGKTALTRGIAKGASSNDHVSSPTFTISKIYSTERFEIHHFDFYRLDQPGLMSYELNDLIGGGQAVIIVEWGDIVENLLPIDRLRIELTITGDENRDIQIICPDTYGYIRKVIKDDYIGD